MTTSAPKAPRPLPDELLAHLRALVACDTRNPPRAPAGVHQLFAYVTPVLTSAGFVVQTRDLGEGCQWLRAVRGDDARVRPLVNVHIDTVPADPGWSQDPHTLVVDAEGGRATGLGACDTKGAVAAFLVAAARTDGPGELLLTSDEEAGTSRVVRTYLDETDVTGRVILVAEPTQARAVLAHRGIGTASGTFSGVAGHASNARALVDSANHALVSWAARAISFATQREAQGASHSVRFNLGLLEGGLKANMIASKATCRFGVRPPSGSDARAVVDEICALAPDASRVEWAPGFCAPALPAPRADRSVEQARARAVTACTALGIDVGDDVDFFTEAAFFSAAGATAIVYGAGNIAQAHTAGEWVSLDDLAAIEATYARLLLR